jgi:organic hydroperoxide reductase OsmC/OhrA
VGEVEKAEDGVLVLRRIHVVLNLRAPESARASAQRVHGFFAGKCPVYRSLQGSITMTTELVFDPIG